MPIQPKSPTAPDAAPAMDEVLRELGLGLAGHHPEPADAAAGGGGGTDPDEPPGEVQLALADLVSDGNGEVVIYNDSGFRCLAITTESAVVASGHSGAHVTETGEDVSGYRFVTFDNGMTLYYQDGLDLVTQAAAPA